MNLIEKAAQRLQLTAGEPLPGPHFVPLDAGNASPSVVGAIMPGDSQARRQATEQRRAAPRVTLDLDKLQRLGYLVPNMDRSALADEFRHVKRMLLRNVEGGATGSDARNALIMVTSAVEGEGKTFCAINLAMSMAMEVDTSVLLIDVDVMRPSVMQRLGVKADRGLLDLLTRSGVELSDVILDTNVPKLSILPTGTLHNRSTELLSSAAMDSLLHDLARRYSDRIVIFDAPPLLLTTAAPALATSMGQIVMVVEAAKTSRREVAEAFAAVEECPIVMSVLNKCDDPRAARRYAYYGKR